MSKNPSRRARGILLALALAAAGPAAGSHPPYGLSPALDLPLAAGILGMKFHADSRLSETRARPLDLQGLNRADIPAYDRWAIGFFSPGLSEFSSVLAATQLALPIAVNAWDTWRGRQAWHGALTDFVLLQESLLLASALSSYAKSFPMHSTPLTYDPEVSESEKRIPQNASSFFSNHTTTAFATAVFSAYTFQLRNPDSPWRPWIWGGSLAVATGVGSLRILAGKHFPSDVAAGAAVGALCGYLVPRLHARRSRPAAARARRPAKAGTAERVRLDFGLAVPSGSTTPGPLMRLAF